MKYLFTDLETRSELGLKKVGASAYARHPSTEVLCAVTRTEVDRNLKKWCPRIGLGSATALLVPPEPQ